MKPVCVPCQRFFRMKKQGFYFIEAMPKPGESRPAAGTQEPDKWTPYKIWSGDLWQCQGCGATILSGFGHLPIVEHHQPTFEQTVKNLNANQLQVNDC